MEISKITKQKQTNGAKHVKIVGIIPARFGSKRLPGKPLALINGKPMIQHVYERAFQASCWDQLLVATDHEKIKAEVEHFGGNVCMTSPYHLSGTDRIAEACEILKLDKHDLVVNIQGDEPLLPYNSLRKMVEEFKTEELAQIGTLAFKSEDSREYNDRNVVKLVTRHDQLALYFSRSPIPCFRNQDETRFYFLKHLGFYIYSVSFLEVFKNLPQGLLEKIEKLEQLRALENGFAIRVTISDEDSLGVDTPEDLELVRSIIGGS